MAIMEGDVLLNLLLVIVAWGSKFCVVLSAAYIKVVIYWLSHAQVSYFDNNYDND